MPTVVLVAVAGIAGVVVVVAAAKRLARLVRTWSARLRVGVAATVTALASGAWAVTGGGPVAVAIAATGTAVAAAAVVANRAGSPAQPRGPPSSPRISRLQRAAAAAAMVIAIRAPGIATAADAAVTRWQRLPRGVRSGLARTVRFPGALLREVRSWTVRVLFEVRFYLPVLQMVLLWVLTLVVGPAAAAAITSYVQVFPHGKVTSRRNRNPGRLVEWAGAAAVTIELASTPAVPLPLPAVLHAVVDASFRSSIVLLLGPVVESTGTFTAITDPSQWPAGVLPVARGSFSFVVLGSIRIDLFGQGYQLGGKQAITGLTSPKVAGMRPWRRLVNWVRSHDIALSTTNLLRFFTVWQLGFGVGLPGVTWNLFELRMSMRELVIARGGRKRTFSLLEGPSNVVRAAVRWTGRLLPGPLRRAAARRGGRWTARGDRYRARFVARATSDIRAELARQRPAAAVLAERRRRLHAEFDAVLADRADPMTQPAAAALWQRIGRLDRRRAAVEAAIAENEARLTALTTQPAVGGGPLGKDFTPEESALVGAVLAAADDIARWSGQPVHNHGPPLTDEQLGPDEQLGTITRERLVAGLRRHGVEPARAADIADRFYAFAWRDARTGRGVIVVPAERLADLERTGMLGAVIAHERDFHLGAPHDEAAHAAHADALISAFEARLAQGDALEQLLVAAEAQGRLTPYAPIDLFEPAAVAGVPVWVLDDPAAEMDPVLADRVAFRWHGRGVVLTAAVLAEIHAHLDAGRLRADWWTGLFTSAPDWAVLGRAPPGAGGPGPVGAELVQRLDAARAWGVDLTAAQVAHRRSAAWAGFAPRTGGTGGPAWELATAFGTVVLSGEQLSADGTPLLASPAVALGQLAEGAARWLDEPLRGEALLGLVAAALARTPIRSDGSAAVRVIRVRFDAPIATLIWADGQVTRDVELVLQQTAPGRYLLTALHPVSEGAPPSLVADDALFTAAQASVVAIRDRTGQIIGSGVVVAAATATTPARVRTAYHVAELIDGRTTVDGRPVTEVRSLPVDAYGDLAETAAAGRGFLSFGLDSGSAPTLDVAEFAVWGLPRPAAAVRAEPVASGDVLTVVGFPSGTYLVTAAFVLNTRRGLVDTIAMVGGGASGGPAFDAAGRVVLTVAISRAGRLLGPGPALQSRFGARITTGAARPVPAIYERRPFAEPGDEERAVAEITGHLDTVEALVAELTAELPDDPAGVAATIDGDTYQFVGFVRDRLVSAPATERFRLLAARTDAVFEALEALDAAAAPRRPGRHRGGGPGAMIIAGLAGSGLVLAALVASARPAAAATASGGPSVAPGMLETAAQLGVTAAVLVAGAAVAVRGVAAVARWFASRTGTPDGARAPPLQRLRVTVARIVAVAAIAVGILLTVAPAAAADPGTSTTADVVVHRNDTLTAIAAEHDTSVVAIVRANPGRFGDARTWDLIFTGEHLNVPVRAPATVAPPEVEPHTPPVVVAPEQPQAPPVVVAPPAPSGHDGGDPRWIGWTGRLGGAVGALVLLRWWRVSKRHRAFDRRTDGWERIPAAGPPDPVRDLEVLLQWVLGRLAVTPGTGADLRVLGQAGGEDADAALVAVTLLGLRERPAGRDALVEALVAAGLIRIDEARDGARTAIGALARARGRGAEVRAVVGRLRARAQNSGEPAELAALAAYLAGLPDRTAVGRLVADLVGTGLLRIERTARGRVLVPDGELAALLAAAPPQLLVGMGRNLHAMLGGGPQDSAADLAAAVVAVVREAVWDARTARPGRWSRLPLRVRGRAAELARLFDPVRAAARAVDDAAAHLRDMRRQANRAGQLPAAALARAAAAARLEEVRGGPVWRRLVRWPRTLPGSSRDPGGSSQGAARSSYRGIRQGGNAARGRLGARGTRWTFVVAAPGALPIARLRGVLIARAHRRLVDGLPAELRGAAPERLAEVLAEQVRTAAAAVAAAQAVERAAAVTASNAAAVAGFTRRETARRRDVAILGPTRFLPALAGLMGAFPGQAAGAQMIAGTEFAAAYGKPVSWVTQQGAVGTSVAAGAGLTAALLGDRLIRNMVAIMALGAAGSAALLVIGLLPVPALFLPGVLTVGVMGVAGGLVRGRMDRYHPVAVELKDSRDTSYETSFKVAQFVFPLAISQGTAVVGVPVTMVALALVAAALTVAVWVVLRGESPDARPRAPPSVGAAVRGNLQQAFGTPRGLLRWVLSIPLLTALTGLYATALGGAMVDQMVVVNDPTHAVFASTATAVSVLVTVRGVASVLVGAGWERFKELLGRPGALRRALGNRSAPLGTLSEARVLLAVTLLATSLAGPVLWLLLAPGLVPFGVLFTLGAVLTAWARMPTNRWMEGATGASLNNTAKAGSLALGGAVSAAVLGAYSTLVTAQVRAGGDPAALVAAADLRLALLAVPVVLLPVLVARLIGTLRTGTIDELRTALARVGADAAETATIATALTGSGLNDVGSVRALFLPGTWRPRLLADRRHRMGAARRASVELTDTERARLLAALATFEPRSGGRLARGVRAAVERIRQLRPGRGDRAARAPPVRDAAELLSAITQRTTRIAAIPADRWVPEQVVLRDGLVSALSGIHTGEATGPAGLARAEELLAELDHHIAIAAGAGRNAGWRGGTSRSLRVAHGVATTLGVGLLLFGMYSMTILAGAVSGIGEGVLFVVALGAQVVGMIAIAPWWTKLSHRGMTVAMLLASGAGYLLFAAAGGWTPGYYLAAAVMGLAGSANLTLLSLFGGWVARTTAYRRAQGTPVVLLEGVIGFAVLGLVLTLSGMLTLQPLLLHIGLPVAAAVSAGLVALVAAALWLTTPATRWDREVPDSITDLMLGPFRALRHRFIRAVALLYGFTAATIGAFDAMWRSAIAQLGPAAEWVPSAASFGFVAGGVVVAVLLAVPEVVAARRGGAAVPVAGLLQRRPAAFVLGMGALMALGAVAVVVSQHLTGNPALGILAAAYLGEAGSTGMILGVDAIIDGRADLTATEKAQAKGAANTIKAIGQFAMGSGAATAVWAGSTPLPAGWDGVSLLIAAAGGITLVLAVRLVRYGRGRIAGLGRTLAVLVPAALVAGLAAAAAAGRPAAVAIVTAARSGPGTGVLASAAAVAATVAVTRWVRVRGPPAWVVAARRWAARLLRRGPGGGPSLLGGGELSGRERAITAQIAATAPVAEELPASDPEVAVLTGGLDAATFRAHHARGIRAVDGFATRRALAGSGARLVVWAAADGWLHLDSAVLAALRAGALDAAARRALFTHELVHTRHPGRSEADVAGAAPLPDLAALAGVVGTDRFDGRLVPVLDEAGHRVWQGLELGRHPPAALSRLVRVSEPGSAFGETTVGVLWWVDGGVGHVVVPEPERPRRRWGWGRRHEVVDVQLAVGGSAWSVPGTEVLPHSRRTARPGLRVLRIEDPRLGPLFPEPTGSGPVTGPVVVMGRPAGRVDVRYADAVAALDLHGQAVITGGLLTDAGAEVLEVVGHGWPEPVHTGGVLITRRRDDRGVTVEHLVGLLRPGGRMRGAGEVVLLATPAAAVEAVLAGLGVARPGPAPVDRGWAQRLAAAPRYANGMPAALGAELADLVLHSAPPAPVGGTAARALTAGGAHVLWALRADGSLWISSPTGRRYDLLVVHSVVADGQDVLAAGEAWFRTGGSGEHINLDSGHYHWDNSEAESIAALELGRAAFHRHGITFDAAEHRPGHRRGA
ncbi:hypothetical protein [Pseudonocardia sp. GCM10023141]|uniref:hypothetical protein n=1 Tax=Pseudonocardia sp. GCM10023141 TaxID=3252653 RepID=UPI00361973A4